MGNLPVTQQLFWGDSAAGPQPLVDSSFAKLSFQLPMPLPCTCSSSLSCYNSLTTFSAF